MPDPKIAIIILNWNGINDTLECLATVSAIDYPDFKIVVVDNGSTDGSVEAIKEAFPRVIVLETGANLGFAGGNNVGIRWALEQSFDGILVLNNDTLVDKDLLRAFAVAQQRYPQAGIFGAKIYYHARPGVLWFAGGQWDEASLSFRHVGFGEFDGAAYSEPRSFDYMTGCALYATATVYRDCGLFDEDFFLTYEETDWCYRARKHGYQCMFAPDARLWHKVSASFGGASSPLHNYFMVRNKLLWARRHLHWNTALHVQLNMLRLFVGKSFPAFVVAAAPASFVRRLNWAWSSWLSTLARNLADPISRSTFYALRDFYLHRFGDCPQQVRDLRKSMS